MPTLILVLVFYYNLINGGDIRPEIIREYAVTESLVAGVDPRKILYTIEHESGFNTYAINRNDMAQGCDSRGLVQIRSCNHETTDQEAYNPLYSVNFLITNIDKCDTWWKNTCGKYQSDPSG